MFQVMQHTNARLTVVSSAPHGIKRKAQLARRIAMKITGNIIRHPIVYLAACLLSVEGNPHADHVRF